MVSVSEATDWSMRSGTQSKYKALRCTIEHVTSADGVYKTLKNKFLASLVAASREQYVLSELQIREGTEDNSKIIFLISQWKHML